MPIAKVQLSNGRIAKLEVPEGTTQEQVMQFVSSQNFEKPEEPKEKGYNAGTIASESSSAPVYQSSIGGNIPQIAPAYLNKETRASKELPELFGSNIFKGENPAKIAQFTALALTTPDEGELSKIASNIFPDIGFQQDPEGRYLLANNKTGERAIINRPGISPTDFAQFGGLAVAFTPAGRVSGPSSRELLKGALAASGTQSLIEGSQSLSGGQFDPGEIALSAGTQAGGQFLLPKISNKIRQSLGKRAQLQDIGGNITEETINRLEQIASKEAPEIANTKIAKELELSGVLTPEQARNFNLFQSRDVPITRAHVTQKTDDFRELQDAAKKSGAVGERLSEQDARLFEIGREGIENIGPTSSNIVETNANVFGVVDNVVSELDNKVFEAYSAAREVAKGQPRVQLNNLSQAISDSRGSEAISGGIISAIRGVLRNKGLLKTGTNLDINKRGSRLTGDQTRKLTVTESEEIRQTLNRFFDSATPEGKRIIRELKNAIDDDVAEAVGEDIFRDARQAKINFQGTIERGSRNKFDKTKGSFLEDVINNKIPEEKIVQRLVSGRDDDFMAMRRFLLNDSGREGIQAFNNIKAQVLRDALDKAVTQGKGEGGQAVFNALGFKRYLEGLKKTKKYNALFNEQERKLIDDIIKIGRLRIPQRSVAQGSGPSGFAIQAAKDEIKRTILQQVPLIGERAQAIVDALQSSKAVQRQLDPLKETAQALRQPLEAFDLVPNLIASIQAARQTASGSSSPTNY